MNYCGYLNPAHVEEELEECEYGNIHIHLVTLIPLGRVQELTPKQRTQEKGVNCKGGHLQIEAENQQGGIWLTESNPQGGTGWRWPWAEYNDYKTALPPALLGVLTACRRHSLTKAWNKQQSRLHGILL